MRGSKFSAVFLLIAVVLAGGCARVYKIGVLNESEHRLKEFKVESMDNDVLFSYPPINNYPIVTRPPSIDQHATYSFDHWGSVIPKQLRIYWTEEETGKSFSRVVPARKVISSWRYKEAHFVITPSGDVVPEQWSDCGDYSFLVIQGESEESKMQRELNNRLIQALQVGDVASAENYISAGADVSCHRLGTQVTPLSAALGDIRCMELLMKYHAPIRGELIDAVVRGDKRSVQFFIESGADVNALWPETFHQLPLFAAVRNQHHEIAQLLIENGADVHATFSSGTTTPVNMARSRNDEKMIEILENAGAK